MTSIVKSALLTAGCISATLLFSNHYPVTKTKETLLIKKAVAETTPKIQAAILLDVSNSMDGLIDQAKAQLWNMVSTMGKAQCEGRTPQIEIALYEYGRPENDVKNGYVKQISGFTSDLDELSQKLFSLTTNGGEEYCGKVIFNSLDELNWDTAAANYKVIFIAGNEDFLQGDLQYTSSCNLASKKGVIINTIYCGDRMQGIKEHWNLGSECGKGSYTNINQDARIEDIPTPYDSLIMTYNQQLNGTYIAYGYNGAASVAKQEKVDKMNYNMSKTVALKRVTVKTKKELYKNAQWDAVDAAEDDNSFLEKVDIKLLPDSLQHKNRDELKKIISQKKIERTGIQDEIGKLAVKRESYIAEEKKKKANNSNVATLETEIEKIIKKQARLFNMIIK
jgi:hypothetical protein